jgi:hypothetical protein
MVRYHQAWNASVAFTSGLDWKGGSHRIGGKRVGCKLLIVGFDGLDAEILFNEEWRGRWPTLESIWANGNSGVCIAELAATGPSWTTIYTGRSWTEHHVHDAWARNVGGTYTFQEVEFPFLWDWMNAAGLKTGVINLPVTYPPLPLDGFMVSGFPVPNDALFIAYPDDLQLPAGYIVDYTNTMPFDLDAPEEWCRGLEPGTALAEMARIARYKIELLQHVPILDMMAIQFLIVDHIGHIAEGEGVLTWLLKAVDICDELLKDVLQIVKAEMNVIISDHGFLEGGHTHYGVFAACGGGLARASSEYSNLDVLPMLLELVGISGDELPGTNHLVWETPRPIVRRVHPMQRQRNFEYSDEEQLSIERQLRALGYLE